MELIDAVVEVVCNVGEVVLEDTYEDEDGRLATGQL